MYFQQQVVQNPHAQVQNQNQQRSLWIGDIEPWMDENYLTQLFAPISPLLSVKLIKDKMTGLNSGYGFLEFQTHQAASLILQNYNGNKLPNATKPFKLNWGQHTKQNPGMLQMQQQQSSVHLQETSIYVCDLDIMTTQQELLAFFQQRYPSASSVKLIQDPNTGLNKGYGFIKLMNPDEANRAIKEMNGQIFRGRILKVSNSFTKNQQQLQQIQMQQNQHIMQQQMHMNMIQGIPMTNNPMMPNPMMMYQAQPLINPAMMGMIPQQITKMQQMPMQQTLMQPNAYQNIISMPSIPQIEIVQPVQNMKFQQPIMPQEKKVQVVAIQNKEDEVEEWTFNLNTEMQKQLFSVEKAIFQKQAYLTDNQKIMEEQECYKNFKIELHSII